MCSQLKKNHILHHTHPANDTASLKTVEQFQKHGESSLIRRRMCHQSISLMKCWRGCKVSAAIRYSSCGVLNTSSTTSELHTGTCLEASYCITCMPFRIGGISWCNGPSLKRPLGCFWMMNYFIVQPKKTHSCLQYSILVLGEITHFRKQHILLYIS